MNYQSHASTSRDEDAFVSEVDVLVRIFVLNIEQQSELTRCISNLRNFKKFEGNFNCWCARKGFNFQNEVIIVLNAHPPPKFPLGRLWWMQYKTCVGGFFTQEDHEVEEMGLFDIVGIIMGVNMVLKACAKIVKQLNEGGTID